MTYYSESEKSMIQRLDWADTYQVFSCLVIMPTALDHAANVDEIRIPTEISATLISWQYLKSDKWLFRVQHGTGMSGRLEAYVLGR